MKEEIKKHLKVLFHSTQSEKIMASSQVLHHLLEIDVDENYWIMIEADGIEALLRALSLDLPAEVKRSLIHILSTTVVYLFNSNVHQNLVDKDIVYPKLSQIFPVLFSMLDASVEQETRRIATCALSYYSSSTYHEYLINPIFFKALLNLLNSDELSYQRRGTQILFSLLNDCRISADVLDDLVVPLFTLAQSTLEPFTKIMAVFCLAFILMNADSKHPLLKNEMIISQIIDFLEIEQEQVQYNAVCVLSFWMLYEELQPAYIPKITSGLLRLMTSANQVIRNKATLALIHISLTHTNELKKEPLFIRSMISLLDTDEASQLKAANALARLVPETLNIKETQCVIQILLNAIRMTKNKHYDFHESLAHLTRTKYPEHFMDERCMKPFIILLRSQSSPDIKNGVYACLNLLRSPYFFMNYIQRENVIPILFSPLNAEDRKEKQNFLDSLLSIFAVEYSPNQRPMLQEILAQLKKNPKSAEDFMLSHVILVEHFMRGTQDNDCREDAQELLNVLKDPELGLLSPKTTLGFFGSTDTSCMEFATPLKGEPISPPMT